MVVAKDDYSHASLCKQFKEHTVRPLINNMCAYCAMLSGTYEEDLSSDLVPCLQIAKRADRHWFTG